MSYGTKSGNRATARPGASLRLDDGATGPILRGYAAKFNRPSEDLGGFVEFIRPGAFKDSIVSDDIRALVDHDSSLILGRSRPNSRGNTLRLAEDATGLAFELRPPDTRAGRDIVTSVKRGDVTGCSFGFIAQADSWTDAGGIVKRELILVKLFDVSIVTYPAYADTAVGVRGNAGRSIGATPKRDAAMRWYWMNAVR